MTYFLSALSQAINGIAVEMIYVCLYGDKGMLFIQGGGGKGVWVGLRWGCEMAGCELHH